MKFTGQGYYINKFDGGYWRADIKCSDGRVVSGISGSKAGAERLAQAERADVDSYLKLTNREKLQKLLTAESLGSTAQEEAIRLLANIVLNNE